MRLSITLIAVFTCLYSPCTTQAQEDSDHYVQESFCCEDGFWEREKLTGDWRGHRNCLAQNGLVIESSLTQFYQGVASGGTEQIFRYGNKLDLFLLADTEKLGLWKGGKLQIHAADWQFGQNIITDATGLASVNTAMMAPELGPSFAITTFLLEQHLFGDYAAIVGRSNIIDFWSALYPDYGRGTEGFMNMAIPLPMNAVPSLPFITNVAGLMKSGERGLEAAFIVMDTENTPTTIGLNIPNGVTLTAIGRKHTDLFCLPGHHTLMATYATGNFTSFDTQGWVVLPSGGVIPSEESGTWMVSYLAEQKLWIHSDNEKRYTKLFGKVGVSDDTTSPFGVTGSLSLEAFGPMDCRPDDRMGIGYFYNGLNRDFKNLFLFGNPLQDLHGGEVYYNAEITPWFHLTADLQAINPGPQTQATAIVFGLRAKLDF